MIYTIGHTASYERGFIATERTGQPLLKRGKTKDYSGGSVWKTHTEALAHARRKGPYSVYGVIADWETETEPSLHSDWHELLVDARLVRLGGRVKNSVKQKGEGNERF